MALLNLFWLIDWLNEWCGRRISISTNSVIQLYSSGYHNSDVCYKSSHIVIVLDKTGPRVPEAIQKHRLSPQAAEAMPW